MIKMSRLKQLKDGMELNKARITSFRYSYGTTNIEVILFDLNPMILTIIEIGTNKCVNLEVSNKFEIDDVLSPKSEKILKDILKLVKGKGFDFSNFLKNLNKKIPNYFKKTEPSLKECVKYIPKYIEEADKRYYCGNNDHVVDGNTVSEKNLNKTLIYLGEETFKNFKESGVSSCWTTKEILESNPQYKKYRNHPANQD